MQREQVIAHEHSVVSLRDMAHVFFKYKNRIALIVVTAVLTALAYLLYVDNSYEAEVKILVLLGHEKFSAMEAYKKEDFSVVFQERGENIANEMEIIQDKAIAHNVFQHLKEIQAFSDKNLSLWQRTVRWVRKVMKGAKDILKWPLYKIGLAHKLTDDQLLLLELQGSLHVEFLEVTDIIRATFRNSDPEVAALVLNIYIQEYLKHRMFVLGNSNSKGFYEEQIQLYSGKLDTIETNLEYFRNKVDISSLSLQRDLILHEITNVQSEYNEKQRELDQIQMAIKVVQSAYQKDNQWVETPDMDKALPDFQALDKRYMDLFARKYELLDTHTLTSREVRSLDSQMKELRDEKTRNIQASLATRKEILTEMIVSYDSEIDQHRQRLRSLDNNERQLRDLERQRDLIETTYLTYSKKAEELRISSDLTERQITSVKVISPAVPPVLPVSPKKKLILALASFLGLLIGLGYAAIARFFDHTFNRAVDVERVLGVPLLATFSFTGTDT